MRQTVRQLARPSWIAAGILTVLSSAAVAALTLTSAPVATTAPAAAPATTRVVAAFQSAPQPVSLSFPAEPVRSAPVAPTTVPPAAPAPPPVTRRVDPRCEGQGWQQRRGQAALAGLRRPADARAVPVAFRPARPDVLGLADLGARSVQLFVRTCARQSDALVLHVLAHELGHVLDVTTLTDADRAAWLTARGIPAGTPWFGCNACTDFGTPAGDFAETYAQWQRGATSSRSELAPAASRAQLEELARRFF